MYKFAISRPITTLMFALALIFFGLMSLQKMPVSLFPDVDFPIVRIKTTYAGAGPETIETKVTDKIEEAVMGIDGVDTVTSTSVRNASIVVVKFKLEKSIDEAINDVRDKVSSIQFDSGVDSPTIDKADTSSSPVITLFVSSDQVPQTELMKHVNDRIKPILQRVSGVGLVDLKGYREREIKILPNPTLVNKYRLTYKDISDALRNGNVEIDGGKIVDKTNEWSIITDANSQNVEDIGNVRVADGVKLKDIAEIKDGLSEDTTFATYNKTPGVILDVQKIAGKNDIQIADGVKALIPKIEELDKRYTTSIVNDTTDYIKDSIADVKFDLVLGALLAVSIVFLFLRNATITLVSAISIPVSVLGTFALVYFAGFTLNMITMLAVTLAIGIIIDDAIVVIENIHKKLEHGMSKREAAYEGVREIGFALVAISAMLLSVFIPVGSMSGIVGRFFQSFGITIALAIGLSYIVVVTVIPMVSAIVVNPKHSKFYYFTEPFFTKLDLFYAKILSFVLRFKYLFLVATFGIFALSIVLLGKTGVEFMLKEDKNKFNVYLSVDPGISLEEMEIRTLALQEMVNQDKDVKFSTLEIGFSNGVIYKAKIYAALKPSKERERSQFLIMDEVTNRLRKSPYAKNMTINASEVSDFGGGDNSPYQVNVMGTSQAIVEEGANNLMKFLAQNPNVVGIHSSWTGNQPEYRIKVNRAYLNKYGITAQDIGNALSSSFSGEIAVAYFKEAGKEYNITVRVPNDQRVSIDDLKKIQVKNTNGELMFLDGLVEFTSSTSASSISRLDRQKNITVYASVKAGSGLSLSEMIKATEENKHEWLPQGASYKTQGESENMQETASAFGVAIMTAFVLIYLILAALYESLVQPIIIMITLPLSFAGAFIALFLAGQPLSMFSFMGLMLLMGLVGKNATLLIDVANEKRDEGMEIDQALMSAGELRLRPILMTTIAMVFGMIPLAIASGSGSAMKSPLGVSVIGGLLLSMMLSLLIVPVFYKILAPFDKWLHKFYKAPKD
ncbi:acriflavin resistance protein [Helicobacter cholecystus]|uniref:Acriflavin resistance protein n=1 Tax=Helicobacter cholecystus TaxID=45498 RepID=A0A3D8IW68_9HELI|nr:efflux RND transporter permease subunit [Helicobacter cholecystus]RDU69508.1 acriflavin resistance protein [Helicobacter cholecystus]VEJ24061.1 acriflavine resistance protein [Helicobacter cholecystus]